jgi:hypothetical protein
MAITMFGFVSDERVYKRRKLVMIAYLDDCTSLIKTTQLREFAAAPGIVIDRYVFRLVFDRTYHTGWYATTSFTHVVKVVTMTITYNLYNRYGNPQYPVWFYRMLTHH